MDFEGLTRRELQALCKRNKIPANQTNIAMADALQALSTVEGIEDLPQLEKGFQTPAPSRTNQRATRKKTELPSGAVVIEVEDSVAPVSRVTTRRRTTVKSTVFRKVSSEEEEGETKNDADLELLQSPVPIGAATARKAMAKKVTKSLVTHSNMKTSVRRSARLKSVYTDSDELLSVVTKYSNKISAKVSELIEEADELKDIAAETAVETVEIADFTNLEIKDKNLLFPPSNDRKELIEEPAELIENLPKAAGQAATNVDGVDDAGLFPSSNNDLKNPGGETESYLAVEVLEAMTLTEESKSELFNHQKEETVADELKDIAAETAEIADFTNLEIKDKNLLFPRSNDRKELIEEPAELIENLPKAAGKAATNVDGVDDAGLFPSSNNDLKNPGGETESYSAVKVLEAMTLTEESKSEVFNHQKEETVVVTLPSITNSRSNKMAVKAGAITKEQESTESIQRKVVTFEPEELIEEVDELQDSVAEAAVETFEIADLIYLDIEDKTRFFPSLYDGKELIEEPTKLTENLAKAAEEAATYTNVVGEDAAGLFPSSNGDLQYPGDETKSYSAVLVLEEMAVTEESKSEVFDGKEETAVVTLPSITNSRSKKMAVKIGSMTKEQELTQSIPRKVIENRASLFLGSHDLPHARSEDSVAAAMSEESKSYEEKASGDIQSESLLPEELMLQSHETMSDASLEKGDMSGELDEVDHTGNLISESLLPKGLMPQSDENKSDALLEKGESMSVEPDEVDDTGNNISASNIDRESPFLIKRLFDEGSESNSFMSTEKKESVVKTLRKTGATPSKSDGEKKTTEVAADKENNGGAYGIKKESALQQNLKDLSLRKLKVMCKEKFSALQPLDHNCNARK